VCLPQRKINSFFFFPPFGVLIFSPQPTQKQLDSKGENQRKRRLDKEGEQ
jgi:hypothetical protein